MKSAVAGIIDSEGHFRVVVTQRRRMRHHVGKGERLFVVPGLLVQEPVTWDDIPKVIGAVENYIYEWICSRNDPVWRTGALGAWKKQHEQSDIIRRFFSP